MEMTKDALKTLMSKPGSLLIMFDNDEFWYFVEGADAPFSDNNLETINGVDFVKKKDFIYSKKGGPNGGINKADISTWMYKPISSVQGVMVLENPDDVSKIDLGRLYIT